MQIFVGLGLILLLPSAFSAPSEGSLSPVLEGVSKKVEVDQVGVLQVENEEDKIVGGQSAISCEQYPYQVSLRVNGQHFCGGSIIKPSVILTAAHCGKAVIQSVSSLTAHVGTILRSSGGTVHQVASITIHPQYNAATVDFDVALMKLKTPIVLSKCSSAVQFANSTTPEIAVNALATVSGWGTLQSGATSIPETLQYVQVPKVSTADCKTDYGSSSITERMLCFGYTTGGKDSCQGDSGGPLVRDGIQYGIVSWGDGCASPKFPGIYSDVKRLSSWIISNS